MKSFAVMLLVLLSPCTWGHDLPLDDIGGVAADYLPLRDLVATFNQHNAPTRQISLSPHAGAILMSGYYIVYHPKTLVDIVKHLHPEVHVRHTPHGWSVE